MSESKRNMSDEDLIKSHRDVSDALVPATVTAVCLTIAALSFIFQTIWIVLGIIGFMIVCVLLLGVATYLIMLAELISTKAEMKKRGLKNDQ